MMTKALLAERLLRAGLCVVLLRSSCLSFLRLI